jgi:hypothetical protein
MSQPTSADSVAESLRRWAGTDSAAIKAVELLVRFRLTEKSQPWIRQGHLASQWTGYWVDADELELAAGDDVTGSSMKLSATLLRSAANNASRAQAERVLAERATGSFAFPPSGFKFVEDFLEFFDTASISDRILSNADHAYKRWRRDTIALATRNAHIPNSSDPTIAIAAIRKAETEHPIIEPPQLRNILRSHQIWYYSKNAPGDAGAATVLAYKRPGSELTVQETVDLYQTSRWASGTITENDLAVSDAVQHLRAVLSDETG